ncbi:hypothetical protein [Amycolatopsis lurida]|uniref:hypothetical protein n=1 Tax=Amycolatopsis lurida TaxID=31959 RepID=UPI0036583F8B
MAWYVAKSLEVLRGQLNRLAPRRSTVSDGSIGDAAHSSRTSDHNPTSAGQVCARDFTHDPAGGLDCHWLARVLVASGDSRIKYVIWDYRIWTPGVGWKAYSGVNPHTKHLHLSVKAGALGDDGRAWNLGPATPPQEDDMPSAEEVATATVNMLMSNLIGVEPITPGKPRYVKFSELLRYGDDHLTVIRGSVAQLLAREGGITADEIAAKLLPALTEALVAEVREVDAVSDEDAQQIAQAVTDRAAALLGGGQ